MEQRKIDLIVEIINGDILQHYRNNGSYRIDTICKLLKLRYCDQLINELRQDEFIGLGIAHNNMLGQHCISYGSILLLMLNDDIINKYRILP